MDKKKKMPEEAQTSSNQAQTNPSPDEQLLRRQPAPRPTPQSDLQKMQMAQPRQMPSNLPWAL